MGSPVLGQEYKAAPETETDKARKVLAQRTYGVDTLSEVKQARRERKLPFQGKVDPFSFLERDTTAVYMERRGTEVPVEAPRQEIRPLTHIQACRRLVSLLGRSLTVQENNLVRNLYPDGVPEEELDALRNQLSGQQPPAVMANNRS
jgi:hypothetical protein